VRASSAAKSASPIFRFDATEHVYYDEYGEVLPHITGILEKTGWVDSTWFSEESSIRGTAVHELTAHYDLGALDAASCVSSYRNYLLSHVAAMSMIPHEFYTVEEARVSPAGFGGRPDRTGVIYGLKAVLDGKSGVKPSPARPAGSVASDDATSHGIQTALQAILVAPDLGLPAEAIARFCLYWKPNGKFVLEQHRDRRDFAEAYRILKACC
jgi:hypothetical protein